jgi:dienelactone hydrolase
MSSLSVPVRLVMVAMAAGLVSACALAIASSPGARVLLTVMPRVALVDQPVSITVSNLTPDSTVTLTATTTDQQGKRWRSTATYEADPNGDVVVPEANSVGGTYRGREGMGLFRSMRLVGSRLPLNQAALFPGAVSAVRLVASQQGRTVATSTLTRRTQGIGVTERKTTLAREGFIGCYYSPAHSAKAAPAIVYLGGSSGGLPCGIEPSLLASHGYPLLALQYFNAPGLPARLERIPLEYFKRALQWLGRQPGVDRHRLVTMGLSKGGEAALLLGTSYPSLVHGAIEYVGGSIVDSAYSFPSWTEDGKPIPTGTVIPVWKINGPLFLVGATADAVGVSSGAVKNVVATFKTHHRHDYTALTYKGAGHALEWDVPNLPFGNTYLRFGVPTPLGGTLAADSAARTDSWPKLLAFLKRLR